MHITPVKAIRMRCLDCCAGSPLEVRLCTAASCALYPFRMGKNPNRKGKGANNLPLSQKSTTLTSDNSSLYEVADKNTSVVDNFCNTPDNPIKGEI